MWKSKFSHVILTATCLLLCLANPLTLKNANASEDSQSNSSSTKNTPSLKGANFRTLRLAIVKAFTDVRKNVVRMSTSLEWDLLPDKRESIREAARKDFVIPTTITIPNDSLGDPAKWTQYLSQDARKKLQKALFVDDLSQFKAKKSRQGFEKFWTDRNGPGAQLIRRDITDPLLAHEFYGVYIEFNIISNILESSGIEYYFDVDGVTTIGSFPRTSSKDIKWVINIYEFRKEQTNIKYYRFTVKAVVDNFELRFPASAANNQKATLYAAVRFKNDNIKLKPKALLTNNIPIPKLPDIGENFPKEWKDNAAITKELTATLGPLGTQVSGLINAGFLSGTKNATFIAGTVLDFDNGEIKPLAGANWELLNFGRNFSGGFLFGVEPSNDASIFLGPSIQADLLTISAGTRFSGGEDSIETDLAGVVSIDLSRLSGNRSNVEPIKFNSGDNVIGGDWFKAIDIVTEKLAMVRSTLKGDKRCTKLTLEPGIPIDFTETEDKISFLPEDEYKYSIPEGCNLYQGGKIIAPGTPKYIPAGKLFTLSEPRKPLYICRKTNIICEQKAKSKFSN